MTHELKIWTEYIRPVITGIKTFEIRKNDRDFKVGDILILKGYDADNNKYTNEEIEVVVTFILSETFFGLKDDYVVMSIKVLNYNC